MKILNIFKKLISENEIIDEEYPLSWSIEEFKKLRNFNQRIKYCETHLKRISSGSGRIAYKIDEEKVLKLAKNEKGISQNQAEIQQSDDYYLQPILANVFEYEENGLWVEMELARKLTAGDFKRLIGFNFKDYAELLHNHGVEANLGRGFKYSIDKELSDAMWNNDFISSILDYIGSWGVPSGDLERLNTYGIVKRDGKNTIVIVDYGLTEEVFNKHYNKRK